MWSIVWTDKLEDPLPTVHIKIYKLGKEEAKSLTKISTSIHTVTIRNDKQ